MPANRLGIVIVSLLFAGCVSPKSLVDRTGDSAFDNARVASSNESLNPADEVEGEARDAAETRTAKLGAISAPSPSLNRPPNPPHEMPGLSISASDQIRLARADVQSGKLEAAKARYQMVLQQDPQHVDAHHGLAVIADNARDFLTAEQHYKSALQVRPTDVGLLSDHGYSYLLQGKLDESVQILTRATELDPDHRQALNNLGLAFALKKDPERSFAAFRRADGDEAARARIAKLLPDQNPQPIASAVAAESATHPHIVPRTTLASGEAPFPAAHPDAA
ncbi:MAG: tetratricopeptide repeat protein, partial [Planctomycetaceae bacterium]